jgi:hypothetical protein
MSEQHTKGLWYWSQEYRGSDGQPAWSLLGANGYGILSCDAANAPQDLGTTGAADARLIAAAPDLLAALIEANEGSKLYEGHLGRWAPVIAKASPTTTDAGVAG